MPIAETKAKQRGSKDIIRIFGLKLKKGRLPTMTFNEPTPNTIMRTSAAATRKNDEVDLYLLLPRLKGMSMSGNSPTYKAVSL